MLAGVIIGAACWWLLSPHEASAPVEPVLAEKLESPPKAPGTPPIVDAPQLASGPSEVPFYGYCPKPGEKIRVAWPVLRVPPGASGTPLGDEIEHALVARRVHDPRGERSALLAAHRLAPDDSAISLALGEALSTTADADLAISAFDAYLRKQPLDILTARKRARLAVQSDIQHGWPTRELNGVTLVFPPGTPPPSTDQILSALSQDLDDAASFTGTARRSELTVFLYPGREELLAVSCVASWAAGAFGDGTVKLVVGASPRVIRHEILHAQLASIGVRFPTWFDEGAAESFAPRPDAFKKMFALMSANRTWVPFSSMNGSFSELEQNDDANLVYAEAYLMVQLLIQKAGSDGVRRAVQYLSEGKPSSGLYKAVLGVDVKESDLLSVLNSDSPDEAKEE
jgi:hypothetical protein